MSLGREAWAGKAGLGNCFSGLGGTPGKHVVYNNNKWHANSDSVWMMKISNKQKNIDIVHVVVFKG